MDSDQGQDGTAGTSSRQVQSDHPNGHNEAAVSNNTDSDVKTNGDEKDVNGEKVSSEKGVEDGETKNIEKQKEESKPETESNNKNSKGKLLNVNIEIYSLQKIYMYINPNLFNLFISL